MAASTTTALLCKFRALCFHRAALRGAVVSQLGSKQVRCTSLWRQYTSGLTPDPPEPTDEVDAPTTSESPPETDADFLNFDPSSEAPEFMEDYLEQSDAADVVEGEDDYSNSDAQAIFDQKASTQLKMYGMDYDPRDVLRADRKQWSTNELAQLESLPIMHVWCSFNNTYINICDHKGRILTWRSAGSEGYKKSRRGTSFAAQAAGLAAAIKAREFGFERIRVKLKGPGIGRQYSLKGFEQGGLKIASIQDVTPVPHNGCRPRKKRRI